MKTIVFWGDKNLVGAFFFCEGRLSKARANDGILVK